MYRIWDKNDKRYVNIVNQLVDIKEEGFLTNGKTVYVVKQTMDDEYKIYLDANQDKFIIERSTELFDKNGVEIYEGDRVLLHFFNEYHSEQISVYEDAKVQGIISFVQGGFWVEDKDKISYFLWQVLEDAEIEVIGNIHKEDNNV